MATLKINGDTSGYVELVSPAVAGSTSIELDKILVSDSSGNVGIGTGSPSTSLDIVRNGVQPLRVQSTSGTEVEINMVNTGGNVQLEAHNGKFNINADNVGIGTSSPDTKLHVFKATAGSITDYANNGLIVENSGDVGISMHTPNANAGHLMFGSPANEYHSYIRGGYGASTTSTLKFYTDNINTMTHKAGNVGIGTDSPDAVLDVTRVGDGTIAIFQNTGTHGIEFSAPSSTALQIASRQGSKNLDLWANTLTLSAGGSESMLIDSSGRVKIGTNETTIGDQQLFISGTKTSFATLGYSLWQNQLAVHDNRIPSGGAGTEAGVGGSISFTAEAGGGQKTWLGLVEGYKQNSTAGDYGGGLKMRVRQHNNATMLTGISIDSTARVTMPNQPRVFANGNISNWTTGTANQVYTAWQTTGANGSYAVGISYDAATGRFTVPVAGTYYIHSTKYMRLGPGYPSTASRLNIRKNGGVFTRQHTHSNQDIPDISISIEALIPMSAGDYFDVIEDYTVSHYRGNGHTWLHAYLVC